MKYLALIFADPSEWDSAAADEREAVYAQYRAFAAAAGGSLVDGAELATASAATTVRVRGGDTQVTDGPFAETKEQLAGFFVFECDGIEEAVALAAQIPGATRGAIEVRPAYVEEAA